MQSMKLMQIENLFREQRIHIKVKAEVEWKL